MGFRFLLRGIWWCVLALGAVGALRGADAAGDAAKFPPPEAWQVAGIRAALNDPSPVMRACAIGYCSDKHWARQLLKEEDLLPLLKSTDGSMRYEAAFALGEMGPEAAPRAVQALLPLLKIDDDRFLPARVVVQALAKLGHETTHLPLKELVLEVTDPDVNNDRGTMTALQKIGRLDAVAAVNELVPLLKEDSKRVIPVVAFYVGLIGREAGPVVARRMLPLLKDSDAGVRRSAAFILGRMGHLAAPYMKQVLPLLKDPNEEVKCSAVIALGQMGREAGPWLEKLLPQLPAFSVELRTSVAKALGELGPEAGRYAPQLLPLLEDSDYGVRRSTVIALGKMGRAAAPHAGALLRLLSAADWLMNSCVEDALAAMGEETAPVLVPELLRMLKSGDKETLPFVFHLLGVLGKREASKVVPAIRPFLQDADGWRRIQALSALMRLGQTSTPEVLKIALPLLKEAGLRGAAVSALGKLGADSAPVVLPALLSGYTDPDSLVREAVMTVFDRWGNSTLDPAWQCAVLAGDGDKNEGSYQHIAEMRRLHLYLWSGHDPDLLLSVRWLGRWHAMPLPVENLSAAGQQAVLRVFLKLWPHSADYPTLRREMALRIVGVAQGITTAPDEKLAALLKELAAQMAADDVADSLCASAAAGAAVQGALERRGKAGR